jgi:hypothetical protein
MLRILENIREGSETGSDLKPTEVGYGSAYGSEKSLRIHNTGLPETEPTSQF